MRLNPSGGEAAVDTVGLRDGVWSAQLLRSRKEHVRHICTTLQATRHSRQGQGDTHAQHGTCQHRCRLHLTHACVRAYLLKKKGNRCPTEGTLQSEFMVTGLVQKSTSKEVAKRLPQLVVKFSPNCCFIVWRSRSATIFGGHKKPTCWKHVRVLLFTLFL